MNKILLFLILFSTTTFAQTQMGQLLIGTSNGDQFGKSVTMSSDGNIVAIGAPNSGTGGNYSGRVSVYQFDGTNWNQFGITIEAESPQDHSGYSIDLSDDGSILVIGAPDNDGNGTNSGSVRIYEYAEGNWLQIGQDIDGESINDYFGSSVTLSANGQIVAIGADRNNGPGSDSGHVRVYQYVSETWVQIGQTIDGEAPSDYSGGSVSLSSDGNRLAIGAQYNDGFAFNAGHTRVFEFSGTSWLQIGADIDGEAANDNSGNAVSLSGNGNVIAIGAVKNSVNGDDSGHARIYQYNGSAWIQLGADIDGDEDDRLGFSVSLSDDGNIIAVGAPHTSPGGGGKTFLFQFNGSDWVQVGADLVATSSIDKLGTSVKLSSDGNKLVVGSSQYSAKGSAQIIDFSSVLSLHEYTFSSIKFYPNPVSNYLTIENPSSGNIQLQVINQLGQIVLKQNKNTSLTSIDVSNLSKGLYFLNIHSETGEKQTIKFIKN